MSEKNTKLFWRREEEDRLRKCKTSDFFEANLRTFEAKHRNFITKKSDVFGFRTDSDSPKAFYAEGGDCTSA